MTPDSYEEGAIDLLAQMLCACPTWQSLIDAADATAAQGRVVLRWGGDATTGQAVADAPGEGEESPGLQPLTAVAMNGDEIELGDGIAYAVIDETGPTTHTPAGVGDWDRSGSLQIALHLPPTAGDQPWQILRRAGNSAGLIAQELRDQVGGAGGLVEATITVDRPELDGQLAEQPLMATVPITAAWSA